jgi:hypothetical protein
MTGPREFAAGELLARHALGHGVPQEIRHMCPAEGCGNPPSPFCQVCLGVGTVTEDRLARWQAQVLREAGEL